MSGVGQEASGIGQHSNESGQVAQVSQGDHLVLHTGLVIVEPPSGTLLDLGNSGGIRKASIKKDGQKTASDTQRVVFRSEQMQTVRVQIPIEHPKKWSPKQPALYECHITTKFDDKICDEAVSNFGIRVLALDPVRGLQINGETFSIWRNSTP